jgi:hypothetical protein
MEFRPGARLRSVVCTTEVVVVRPAPGAPGELACGGRPMVPLEGASTSADAVRGGSATEGTLLGKRYADPASGLEVLCTKAGKGSLSLGDALLQLKGAKPLPSSD